MRGKRFIWLPVLGLLTLACLLPFGNPSMPRAEPSETVPPTNTAETMPSATTAPQTTATFAEVTPPQNEAQVTPSADAASEVTPTATAAPDEPAGWPQFNYRGISFRYPPELVQSFTPRAVAGQVGEGEEAGWIGTIPPAVEIGWNQYPIPDPFHAPVIVIYPADRFAEVNEAAAEQIARLSAVFSGPALPEGELAFLPLWNAAQFFQVQAERLDFNNGKGLRYLACSGQAQAPIDETCLYYTYQGLTADGKYYVSGLFMLDLPALKDPKLTDLWAGYTQAYDEALYRQYQEDALAALSVAQPADFTPNLAMLDQVMASLTVNPESDLLADEGLDCPGAPAARLAVGTDARVTYTDGTPLRIRNDAGKNGLILGLLPEGAALKVLAGPRCIAEGMWWQVKATSQGYTGWVLEGEGSVYYVEPR